MNQRMWMWIWINLLAVGGAAAFVWLFRPHPYAVYRSAQFAGSAAVLLFAANLSYAGLFQAIKRGSARRLRVTLAKLARKLMPWHIPIGIIGTALVVVHAGIMLPTLRPAAELLRPTPLSGGAAVLLLCLTLLAGVLRSRRASGFRRKFHLSAALLFAAAFLVHWWMS